MERPSALLKPLANRMAHSAIFGGGSEFARLIRLSGLLDHELAASGAPRSDVDSSSLASKSGSDRVGIWERTTENGACFVRRMDKRSEWHFWANVGRINPKESRQRVVLLGESVARGFLYDPEFTPTAALERILQSRLGRDKIEVVDLARTDLTMETLIEVARSAIALEPDAVVIFAGNNWRPSPKNLDDVRLLATVLRERGVPGLFEYNSEHLAANVRSLVKTINSLFKSRAIPVIWLIPEYNLAEWRDPEMVAPWLPNGSNLEWMSCWQAARDALDKGDVDAAFESASRMVEFDQGVSGAAFYMLAECSQRSGDQDAARSYLEKARDAQIWEQSNFVSPRPYSVAQQILRTELGRCRIEVVDLPDIFKSYLGGDVVGRRLFWDYCHMTAEGIRVAMASAAAVLLRSLSGIEIPWNALVEENNIAPAPEVEAAAAFLAAIHNAHWGQTYEQVRYCCQRSIKASPEISQVMTHFIDMQTRQASNLLCKSSEGIAALGLPLIAHYLINYSLKRLDELLLDAVADALSKSGVNPRKQLDTLRKQEHSAARRPIDLLHPYYSGSFLQQREVAWRSGGKQVRNAPNDYYRAHSPESRFRFVGDPGIALQLRVTYRLPGVASSTGTVSIEVNGRQLLQEVGGPKWETRRLMVATDLVKDGLNEVVIKWPPPEFRGDLQLDQAADDIEQGHPPDLFPVFGEIHSLLASVFL